MSKTPEEMATEYADDWQKDCDYPEPLLSTVKKATRMIFLAGYQAAKDQLADADKVMFQWISVEERLPEIPDNRLMSDDVLWLTRYGEIEVSCLERLRSEFRVDWGDAGLLKLDQFTHWMPLPEPPKDAKE